MSRKLTDYKLRGEKIPGSYARNVNYEEAYRKVFKALEDHIKEGDYERAIKDLILFIQLANGMRISEAIEVTKHFIETGEYEYYIEAKKGGEGRIVRLPPQIPKVWLSKLKGAEIPSRGAVIMYAKRTFGVNTHAFRHAFITYMAKKGMAPQMIAKITGHKKLDMILRYTERKKAEEIHKNILEEMEVRSFIIFSHGIASPVK